MRERVLWISEGLCNKAIDFILNFNLSCTYNTNCTKTMYQTQTRINPCELRECMVLCIYRCIIIIINKFKVKSHINTCICTNQRRTQISSTNCIIVQRELSLPSPQPYFLQFLYNTLHILTQYIIHYHNQQLFSLVL